MEGSGCLGSREGPLQGTDLLLFDGECGMCRRAVAWVLTRAPRGRLVAMPYQDASSPPMTEELRAACAQAVHVVTADGRVLRAGSACLFLLAKAGHPTLSRLLGSPPLLPLVELGYRLVAGNRRFWSRLLFRGRS